MIGKEQGFISAPLIGTLIFLAAVLFIVHMSQVEKSEVANIVSNTYHTTITSGLEQYRSDMGSLFATSLSRAVEKFLSRGLSGDAVNCTRPWDFLLLQNRHTGLQMESPDNTYGFYPPGIIKPTGAGAWGFDYDKMKICYSPSTSTTPISSPLCKGNGNNELDYAEARYRTCIEAQSAIKAGLCAVSPDYGIAAWINKASQPVNFSGFTYDVPNYNLAQELSSNYICDFTTANIGCAGTDCNVSNDAMFSIIDPGNAVIHCTGQASTANGALPCKTEAGSSCEGATGVATINTQKQDYCNQLITGSMFDCRNFAENLDSPYRCCSEYYSAKSGDASDKNNGRCCDGFAGQASGCSDRSNHVVEGCESGSFLVNVSVLANDEVYKRLPRTRVIDKAGNEIQGGALGDENMIIPIKYPFYKYLDAAFMLYAPFAYGVGGSTGVASNNDFLAPDSNEKVFQATPLIQDDKEGVAEGLCYGNCTNRVESSAAGRDAYAISKKIFTRKVDVRNFATGANAAVLARQKAATAFYNTFLANPASPGSTSVCRMFQNVINAGQPRDFRSIKVMLTNLETGKEYQLCPTPDAGIKNALMADTGNFFQEDALASDGSGDCSSGQCAYVGSMSWNIRFEDSDASSLINPVANQFCFGVWPVHFNPV